MSVWQWLTHLSGFLAAAVVSGLVCAAAELMCARFRRSALQVAAAWFLYAAGAAGVLMLGLALWGRDGRLATYFLMCATLGALAAWRTR